MLIRSGSIRLRASCSQILDVLVSDKLGKVLNDTLKLGKGMWSLVLRGESKERSIGIDIRIQRDEARVRVEGISEMGLQGLLMEFSCSEGDGYAHLSYTIAINPVALGVNRGVAETTLNTMVYRLDARLQSILRESIRVDPAIADRYLTEEFIAKAVARGEIVDKRSVDARSLDIKAIATKYPDKQLLISATAEGVDLKVAIIGASYAAKLKFGELEYRDEQAVTKIREFPGEVKLIVYSIDRLLS